MKKYYWYHFYRQMDRYLELNLLPHLIAFGLAKLFYSGQINNEDSYEIYYNSFKSLINISHENKELIYIIVKQILKEKYYLKIKKKSPLVLIKIKN